MEELRFIVYGMALIALGLLAVCGLLILDSLR